MRLKIPGDMFSYYGREREQYNEAFGAAEPTAEEKALMEAQVKAVQQAYNDRKYTRSLVLGQMGFKYDPEKKKLVPLTNEERRALMSTADKSRADAAGAYQERAKAAATGTTKLPSFLKKDIDYQKVKEQALLEEMMGPEAVNSTAGKQVIEAMKKKEEQVRQQIQEQDLASTPGRAMGLSGQLEAQRRGQIGAYEALPRRNQGLIAGRGSLLQQMQQKRLDELKRRLAELEMKRQGITSIYTLGGTVGGAAAAAANNRKTVPEANSYSGISMGGYNNFYQTPTTEQLPAYYTLGGSY